jgi:hypothetical protein
MRGRGKPFVKGDPRAGRPKGSRNKAPASVRALLEHLAAEKPELYEKAIKRGLAAGGARSYPFVALAASYIDRKPVERVAVVPAQRLFVVPMGSTPDLGDDDLHRT